MADNLAEEFVALMHQPPTIAFCRLLISEAPRFPKVARMTMESAKRSMRDVSRSMTPKRTARQFLAISLDQVIWPAMFKADFTISDREMKLAVDEAMLAVLARNHGQAEAVTGNGDRPHEVGLMIDPAAYVVAGSADGDHQRDQMILLWMRSAGGGRSGPIQQAL